MSDDKSDERTARKSRWQSVNSILDERDIENSGNLALSELAELKNPNLRRCPDCQEFASSEAVMCPSCGAPIRDRENNYLFIFLLAICVGGYLLYKLLK